MIKVTTFEEQVSINAMLYILNKTQNTDIHHLFKLLYFADREHFCKYGRNITGDDYIAMQYGPVPSQIYDIVKDVRFNSKSSYKDCFKMHDSKSIVALKQADMDYLSESDIEEMNNVIDLYNDLSFNEITHISHGSAWKNTDMNTKISVDKILHEAGADDNYINYIKGTVAIC